jgi:hypothetical protein
VVNKSVTTLTKSRIITNGKFRYFESMLKHTIFFSFLFGTLVSFSQVVNENIQIDTLMETVRVIYKPTINTTYYFKKIAVFADDTSQVAVEKSYTSYGQNGLYKAYYKSGRLKIKTVFAKDKMNGEFTYYDPKGIIIIKGMYKAGVKHGYWAYKSLNIFGRYKRGVKNRKWKRFDPNGKKYLSHYKHGNLTGGEGYDGDEKIEGVAPRRNIFSAIFPKKNKKKSISVQEVDTLKGKPIQEDQEVKNIKEQEQAISFLKTNALFKRKIKEFSKGSIKKHFKHNVFKFDVLPQTKALSMSYFFKEVDDDKIVVAVIDLLLKNERDNLLEHFNGKNTAENINLNSYSTNNESPIKITFSDLKYNLLRIDVDWKKKEENLKFRLLLYFDNKGVLKGAEYEKP